MTTSDRTRTAERTRPWQDSTRPVAERVELLLAEMTLEEKVAQLGSRWVGADIRVEEVAVEDGTLNVAPLQDVFAAGSARSLDQRVSDCCGSRSMIATERPASAQAAARWARTVVLPEPPFCWAKVIAWPI